MTSKLVDELDSFQTIWQGGFFAADPLEPLDSPYGLWGYTSLQHAIYLSCIKPYITENTAALEIGPGRGAWTRAMLGAKEVTCLDALSAEHNGFWEYVGKQDHVRYLQVDDFECRELPDNSVDYLFSFDALCHVSFEGISAYMTNLFPRLRSGAQCFIMVADYVKYNAFVHNHVRLDVTRSLVSNAGPRWKKRAVDAYLSPVRLLAKKHAPLQPLSLTEDDVARPGRWYDAGTTKTCQLLEGVGYVVLDQDMAVDYRSPLIHFQKP